MSDLNLVLKFKLADDPQTHIEAATRMKIDGRGNLVLYKGRGEDAERIELRNVRSFSIHPVGFAHAHLAA
jgi:hypothetical protein